MPSCPLIWLLWLEQDISVTLKEGSEACMHACVRVRVRVLCVIIKRFPFGVNGVWCNRMQNFLQLDWHNEYIPDLKPTEHLREILELYYIPFHLVGFAHINGIPRTGIWSVSQKKKKIKIVDGKWMLLNLLCTTTTRKVAALQ